MPEVNEFDNCSSAARAAADRLVKAFADNSNKKGLFLVSGGSSAKVARWVSSGLDINVTNSVTLAQVDERYGEPSHGDSNWNLLLELGLEPKLFHQSIETLKLGVSGEDIAAEYSNQLQYLIDSSDYRVALLGIGADGHIAGILPDNEADFNRRFLGQRLAVAFEAADYERITVTAKALLQMDEIIVYACGAPKHEAIARLKKDNEIHEFPAEILKRCNNVSVYYSKGDQ